MTEHNLFWGFYSEELREIVRDRKAWHAAVHGVEKSQAGLNNWTTTKPAPKEKLHSLETSWKEQAYPQETNYQLKQNSVF